MFSVISDVFKYIFITIIYFFIFNIIRLIYFDIKHMGNKQVVRKEDAPYLKLLNRRDSLNFNMDDSYVLKDRMVIGRSPENDIAISDPFFSTQHACIYKKNGLFYLEDLYSRNGTYLNGLRVANEPREMKNGDRISMGQINFIYIDESDRGE